MHQTRTRLHAHRDGQILYLFVFALLRVMATNDIPYHDRDQFIIMFPLGERGQSIPVSCASITIGTIMSMNSKA